MPTQTRYRRSLNGEAVRAIRTALGIKLSTFAADIGITRQYARQLEAGDRQPSDTVQRKVAERLGVSLDAVTRFMPAPVDIDDPATGDVA
jgi:transcriptional regulator with XRE-family HTH domain